MNGNGIDVLTILGALGDMWWLIAIVVLGVVVWRFVKGFRAGIRD